MDNPQKENNLSIRSEKIVRNTLYNIGGSMWNYLAHFLLTPYIISRVGVEGYGVWSLVFVFINYFAYFDLSVNTSYVKYIAEYYTKGDSRRINEVVNSGGFFYLLFAFLVITLLFPLRSLFLSFFNIPSLLLNDTLVVLFVVLIITLISRVFEVFTAILYGLQRMDVTNKLTIYMTFPKVAGVIFFLERGWGIRGLAINEAMMVFITILATILLSKKFFPEIVLGREHVSFVRFKELFRFGIKLFASRISTFTNFQFDKVLISHFISVGYVTYYDLGSKIVNFIRQFILLITSAVLPAASELQAEGQEERVYSLYRRSTKYVISFGLPIMLFAVISAPAILFGWIGEGYDSSVNILRVLALGYFFNTAAGTISPIVQGIGRPDIQMWIAILSVSLNVPLSIFLIQRFGFLGAALGTTIAMVIAASIYFLRFHRLFQKSVFSSLKDILLIPAISSVTGSLLLYAFYSLFQSFVYSNRIMSLTSVLFTFSLFLFFHVLFLFKSGYLDTVDQKILGRFLPIAKS
jgi:O-antigen/teichoic acid export membrane protein